MELRNSTSSMLSGKTQASRRLRYAKAWVQTRGLWQSRPPIWKQRATSGESNPTDGRSQLIYPTERAQSLKNSKAHIETLFYEWLAEALTEEEREEFARLLDVLYHRCKEESKAGFPEVTARVKERE